MRAQRVRGGCVSEPSDTACDSIPGERVQAETGHHVSDEGICVPGTIVLSSAPRITPFRIAPFRIALRTSYDHGGLRLVCRQSPAVRRHAACDVPLQALLEAVYGKKAVRQMPYDPNHALAWFQSISNEVTRCMDQGTLEVRERDKKAFRWVVGVPVGTGRPRQPSPLCLSACWLGTISGSLGC